MKTNWVVLCLLMRDRVLRARRPEAKEGLPYRSACEVQLLLDMIDILVQAAIENLIDVGVGQLG